MSGIRVLIIWECTIKTAMRSEAEEQTVLEAVEHFFRSKEVYLEL